MPILVADKLSVLSDLPTTLSSLVGGEWGIVAECVASSLVKATERIHDWAAHGSSQPPIDDTEKEMAVNLLGVMHMTCVSLKQHLPVDKQLTLANMVVPSGATQLNSIA